MNLNTVFPVAMGFFKITGSQLKICPSEPHIPNKKLEIERKEAK